jgi:hypothetical protein
VTAAEEPVGASRDETAQDLAREIYWARDGWLPPPAGSDQIGGRLEEFAHRRRVDQRELVPNDEPFLGSSSLWKRTVKAWIWRLSRFSTMRYDRLLAELAELNGELAAQLTSTEEEVARLREELARRREEEP